MGMPDGLASGGIHRRLLGEKGGSVNVKRKWPGLVTLFVIFVLAIAAAGCGGDEGEDATGPGGTGVTDTTAGEAISVAMISDTGGLDDRGFNEYSINGFERAQEELGIDGRVYVSESADDYLPNLTAAVDDGHDLVIAIGFLIKPSLGEVAAQATDVSFSHVDGDWDNVEGGPEKCEEDGTCGLPNVLGLQFPSEEPGYLAGVAAGLTTKTGTVSTVGGIKIPSVDNWIAGFTQGVMDTNPDVTVLKPVYSQDFVDQAKCKEIALDQIAQGSDIVFQVAGLCGLGAIDAACQEGVMAIGVDADQSGAGDCVIFSALKPLDVSVFETIKSVQDGTFEGGVNRLFGVQDFPDAELLTPFTDAVPQEAQDAAAAAEEELRSGEIDPPATLEEVQ
jgi:basic membrane protein A and related proteins